MILFFSAVFVVLAFVGFLLIVLPPEGEVALVDKVNVPKKKIKVKNVDIFKTWGLLFFGKMYSKLVEELRYLYKLPDEDMDKYYTDPVLYSLLISGVLGFGIVYFTSSIFAVLFLPLIYIASLFLFYLSYSNAKTIYEGAMTVEAITYILELKTFIKNDSNVFDIIEKELIARNAGKETSRQLSKLINEIRNHPTAENEKILADFKKTVNGIAGLEGLITCIEICLKSSVLEDKQVIQFCENITRKRKELKNKKIKNSEPMLQLLTVIFVGIFAILQFAGTLFSDVGGQSLLDLLKGIIRF